MAINVLSPRIYNRISAGEVVERPASVVKELVENSLDAGAKKIKIEIEGGGISKIVVSDDGCGIEKDDLPLAFLPHATSKISNVDDLDAISTLGFRGEALASIASVSMITLSTKTKSSDVGYQISADGGDISKISEVARLDGTTISMTNLFYNTPARAKFLKKAKTEECEITHLVEKFMLSRPDVSFEYVVDKKVVYSHNGGKLEEAIYLIYGNEVFENLLPLNLQDEGVLVSGFVVSPKVTRPNRTWQTLVVNGRYVENYQISACIQGAFEPMIMKGRFPIYVVNLSLGFDRVDVNVHPNKREVKFDESSKIFGVIRRATEKALIDTNLIAEFSTEEENVGDIEKFAPEKERDLGFTGFDSPVKNEEFKKSVLENVGKSKISYSVDSDSCNEKVVPEVVDMPQFSSVKSTVSKEKQANRPGGNIFFDNSGDGLMFEVKKLAKKMEEEESVSQIKEVEIETKPKEDRFLTADENEVKIVGVVFKTYIITEFGDSLYVIDQHAMHERQLYDKLKRQIEMQNVTKQDLLVPYEINLKSKDREVFENKLENLHSLGFEIVQKEGNFKILSVPFVLSGINLENFVSEILANEELIATKSQIINEKLCRTACKHAIRAGDSISRQEIFYLIGKIKDGVALCPHGRPIIVKITRKELEKMFKRVL